MTLALRPEFEHFIVEQVALGHFPTAEAVVEAAMADLIVAQSQMPELDAEDWAAIAESDAEFERGEYISLEDLRAEFSKRFGIPL